MPVEAAPLMPERPPFVSVSPPVVPDPLPGRVGMKKLVKDKPTSGRCRWGSRQSTLAGPCDGRRCLLSYGRARWPKLREDAMALELSEVGEAGYCSPTVGRFGRR